MKNLTKPVGDLYPHIKKLTLIMRLSVLLILIAVFTSTASVYSQATKLTIKMENARLSEVFDAIEKQSEFYFFYNRDYFNDDRLVSVDFENKLVDEVLKELFKDEPITFEIYDRNILLTIPEAPLTTAQQEVMQQQRSISGTVTDSGGQPLPGVTIVIKGTTRGTVTNTDGEYSLPNIPENATLVFSFVGMRTQETVVGSQTSINVTMEQETIGLDEVVAVGYGTVKKQDLTGSVSRIKSESLEERAVSTLGEAFAGQLAGVRARELSGEPGRELSITIRGVSTINASNVPLYVVDGIPVGNIQDFNLNDIESIEVLKDASSAAIYGARGANGVVLISIPSTK